MTESSDDVARNMAILAEQIEPIFEAGRGLKLRMKKQGWSAESAELIAREYLIGMIRVTFQPSSSGPDEPIYRA